MGNWLVSILLIIISVMCVVYEVLYFNERKRRNRAEALLLRREVTIKEQDECIKIQDALIKMLRDENALSDQVIAEQRNVIDTQAEIVDFYSKLEEIENG